MEVIIMVIKRNKKLLVGVMLACTALCPVSAQADWVTDFKASFKSAANTPTTPATNNVNTRESATMTTQTTNALSTTTALKSRTPATQLPSTAQNMAGGLLGWAISNPRTTWVIIGSVCSLVSAFITYQRCKSKLSHARSERDRYREQLTDEQLARREAVGQLVIKERALQEAIKQLDLANGDYLNGANRSREALARAQVESDAARDRVTELETEIRLLKSKRPTITMASITNNKDKSTSSWAFWR